MKKKERAEDAVLPINRARQFLDVLRYRFWDVLGGGILACLFAIPYILWTVFMSLSGFVDLSSLYSILLVYGVGAILFSIMGLGSAGLFYFLRKVAFGVGAVLLSDFAEGMRKAWKEGMLSHLFLGLLYLVLKLDIGALASSGFSDTAVTVVTAISYALFYLFACLVLYYMPQCVLYEGSFFRLLGNSARFYVGSFLKSFVISLPMFVPFFVYELIDSWTAEWIVMGVYFLFYGFICLGVSLYGAHLFDKYINPRYYPELVRKGLRPLPGSVENKEAEE